MTSDQSLRKITVLVSSEGYWEINYEIEQTFNIENYMWFDWQKVFPCFLILDPSQPLFVSPSTKNLSSWNLLKTTFYKIWICYLRYNFWRFCLQIKLKSIHFSCVTLRSFWTALAEYCMRRKRNNYISSWLIKVFKGNVVKYHKNNI